MQSRQQQQGNLPGSVQIFGSGAGTNLCVPGSTTGPFPQANELLKVSVTNYFISFQMSNFSEYLISRRRMQLMFCNQILMEVILCRCHHLGR